MLLEEIRRYLKEYFNTKFIRTFILFPPAVIKKTHNPKDEELKGEDKEDNDESDHEEESKFMSDEERFYLFEYFFTKEEDLSQFLVEDAGVDPLEA